MKHFIVLKIVEDTHRQFSRRCRRNAKARGWRGHDKTLSFGIDRQRWFDASLHPFDLALGEPSVCRLTCTRSRSSESISSRLGLHSRAIARGLIYLRRVRSKGKREVHRFVFSPFPPRRHRDPGECNLKQHWLSGIDARPFQLDPIGSRPRTGKLGGGREDHERGNALRRPCFPQRRILHRKGMLKTGTVVWLARPLVNFGGTCTCAERIRNIYICTYI